MRGNAVYANRRVHIYSRENAEVIEVGDTADKLRYAFAGGMVRTEILGRDRVIVEGCDGIIAYGTEQIGFRCGRNQIWINGKNLRMICVDEDSAVLGGQIGEVYFK